MDPDAPPEQRSRSGVIITVVIATLVVNAGAYWWGSTRGGASTPGNTSAEAGFARDMQVHHIQGVELAMMVRDRTSDSGMRQLAYDMLTTQGHQAGQLYGWLASWGLNQLGSEPPMTWMGHPGHSIGALMPGMATPEQVKELSAASGIEAERVFLRLMIAHHRGALEMANAVVERSRHPAVLAFARGVLTSQQAEIDLMAMMLKEREAPQ